MHAQRAPAIAALTLRAAQSWDPLRPLVVNVEGDLKQLREAGVFCAGTTSQELTGAAELVDLLVDRAWAACRCTCMPCSRLLARARARVLCQ